MKFSNVFLALSLLLMVSACANKHDATDEKSPDKATPQDSSIPKDLSAMSLPDALATKYDSAILSCNLWTRMRGPLVISDTPNDTFSVDLLKDSDFPKTINLAAKSGIHSLDVQIKLTEIKLLQNSGYSNDYGAHYSFTNSPAIYGEYSGQTSTLYPGGYAGGPFKGNSLTISENIVSQIVAGSSGPMGEANPTVDYVECFMATKVKPQYKDEWKQDSAGTQPSCLLEQPVSTTDCMIRKN
jgi:hypothetical protein